MLSSLQQWRGHKGPFCRNGVATDTIHNVLEAVSKIKRVWSWKEVETLQNEAEGSTNSTLSQCIKRLKLVIKQYTPGRQYVP